MGEALKPSPRPTLREILENVCPYYMALGVSYDEYWYKDPKRLKFYLKAYEIKQKQENQNVWLQGYYNYIAFAYVSPIFNPFAKKGTKAIPYPTQPFPTSQNDVDENKEIERNSRMLKLKQKLLASTKNKEVVKK